MYGVVASREATIGNSLEAMCWQVVMGCSRMRILRPGGCTAKHSAALLRHHSYVQDAASVLSVKECIATIVFESIYNTAGARHAVLFHTVISC